MIAFLSWLTRAVITTLIRGYQIVISPHIGHCCRFEPSCSQYFIDALRLHGVFRGSWLGCKRILRCRPFGPSGFDPVPDKRVKKCASALVRECASDDF
ncbi:MAG: membrane protein insertion efficiency factor YidD [Kiritimatiellae bacterium]|nr:membrane protein insertion efficiency factor YidD [Kiritimatiellia bacterium]